MCIQNLKETFKKPLIHMILWLMVLIGPAEANQWVSESNLFWPEPPAKPKIFYLTSIKTNSSLNQHQGFFKKITRFITGADQPYAINPFSIALSPSGEIVFTDSQSGFLYFYQPKTKRLKQVKNIAKQSLVSPAGVAVGSGMIFVSDSVLNKVFAINEKNKLVFELGQEEGLLRPTGLFVKQDRLYIVDTLANAIKVYSLKGQKINEFGKKGSQEGEFNAPTHIYVDEADNIYVTDTLNFRVQVFNANGEFLYLFGKLGDGSGAFSRPKGLACDGVGHIYVVDALFDNIQIFDKSGRFLLSFAQPGADGGQLWVPSGIAIDQDNYIYIADTYNQRISIYQYRE